MISYVFTRLTFANKKTFRKYIWSFVLNSIELYSFCNRFIVYSVLYSFVCTQFCTVILSAVITILQISNMVNLGSVIQAMISVCDVTWNMLIECH